MDSMEVQIKTYGDRVIERVRGYIDDGGKNLRIFDTSVDMAEFLMRVGTGTPEGMWGAVRAYMKEDIEKMKSAYIEAVDKLPAPRTPRGTARLYLGETPLQKRVLREMGGVKREPETEL